MPRYSDIPMLSLCGPTPPSAAPHRHEAAHSANAQSKRIPSYLISPPTVCLLTIAYKGEMPSEAARTDQDMLGQEAGHHRENTDSDKVGGRLDEKVFSLTEPAEEPEYPKGIKLGIIIASLAMSVFLCALVRFLLQFCLLYAFC